MTPSAVDLVRGAVTARELEFLGAKRSLIKAAKRGYITEVRCRMSKCYCPKELGGAWYFEPADTSLSDWMPTFEHFPMSKRDGGRETVDNAVLAHRLCNRIDYSIAVGRSYRRDLERIKAARDAARAIQRKASSRSTA
jgi:hypothetical protein